GLEIWKANGQMLRGHGGGFAGFTTRTAFDVKAKLGVIVFTNCIDGLALSICNSIFHTFKTIEEKFTETKKGEDYSIYQGYYTPRWGDAAFTDLNGNLVGYTLNTFNPLEDH